MIFGISTETGPDTDTSFNHSYRDNSVSTSSVYFSHRKILLAVCLQLKNLVLTSSHIGNIKN